MHDCQSNVVIDHMILHGCTDPQSRDQVGVNVLQVVGAFT